MTDRRVVEEYVEIAFIGNPDRRVVEEYVEIAFIGNPDRQVVEEYLEVLIPIPSSQRAGWGILVN